MAIYEKLFGKILNFKVGIIKTLSAELGLFFHLWKKKNQLF